MCDARGESVRFTHVCTQEKNRSGTTSVVVAEKRKGVYRELKTIGVSADKYEIEKFILNILYRQNFLFFFDELVLFSDISKC